MKKIYLDNEEFVLLAHIKSEPKQHDNFIDWENNTIYICTGWELC